jgi:hypothetical protein
MRTADLRDKLFDKHRSQARPGGCVIWTGPIDSHGYGRVYVNGAQHQAHRLAYLFGISVDIPAGRYVLQRCGHPGCIAAAHLYLGGQNDRPATQARQRAASAGLKLNRRGL